MSFPSQFLAPLTEGNSQQHPAAMRTSCSGCRVLRKGCRTNCSIRPCLEWIKSPESQSNATLFLAKFYGRAGLINLINAGPQHLRPAIFRSLLYEACGRIVNPIYGSVGLLWTGNWRLCQATVEAVLRGEPITQIASSDLALKACDIRHVSKDSNPAAFCQLHKSVESSKIQFKRPGRKRKPQAEQALEFMNEFCAATLSCRDSAAGCRPSVGVDSGEGDGVSVESVEALSNPDARADGNDLTLELTLGLTVGDVSVFGRLK